MKKKNFIFKDQSVLYSLTFKNSPLLECDRSSVVKARASLPGLSHTEHLGFESHSGPQLFISTFHQFTPLSCP